MEHLSQNKVFDIINCEFYNKEREIEYLKNELKNSQLFIKIKFENQPPSYKARETF